MSLTKSAIHLALTWQLCVFLMLTAKNTFISSILHSIFSIFHIYDAFLHKMHYTNIAFKYFCDPISRYCDIISQK